MSAAQRPARLTRAEAKARTRELVLDAAADVFRRRGFHVASTDEIAAQAGFTRGAVYSNFATKEELFLAVYDRDVDRRTTAVLKEMEATPADAGASVEAGAAAYAAMLGDDLAWSALVIEFAAHASRDPELRTALADRDQELRTRIGEGLERIAARLGLDLPIAYDQAAWAAQTVNDGAMVQRLLHDGDRPLAVYRLVSGLFVRGLTTLDRDDPLVRALGTEARR